MQLCSEPSGKHIRLARVYAHVFAVLRLGRWPDTARRSSHSAKSSTSMLTFGLSHPYVSSRVLGRGIKNIFSLRLLRNQGKSQPWT